MTPGFPLNRVTLILPVALLLAAGCAAQVPDGNVDEANIVYGTRVHKMPKIRNGAASSPGPAGAHLTYYGGHVISNVKVYEVLYGAGTYSTDISGANVSNFYTQVVNSPFMDWLSEYNTPVSGGTGQSIGRGTFGGKVTISPSSANNGATISDTQIQAEIAAQIAAGHLAVPDANTIYMLHFPHGKTITQGGSNSCQAGGFCAYHGTMTRNSASVFYGVLPDMSPGSGCDTGCGNSTAFANQTSVASHELIEAVTDAEVGLATTVGPPLAWYDTTNGEIGDICNAQQGNFVGTDGVTYVVQQEWSNAQGACVDHGTGTPPPPPANDFSVAASPASLSVQQGTTGTVSVTTAVVSGSAQGISLTVAGLPAGVTGAFSPATVTAGSSSTLTLTVGATAAAATTSFTITGTATSGSHSASGSLTVTTTAPPPPPPGGALANGTFESGLTGWTSAGTTSAVSTSHSGSGAAQVGATASPTTDSSVTQTFTLPSNATTLTFWYQVHCPDTLTYDWATATLKDNVTGATATVLAKTCTNAGSWVQASASVAASAGHSVTLTLASHDDNYPGDPTYTWYDDVVVATGSTPPPPPPPSGGLTNGTFETGTLSGWTSTGTTAAITGNAHNGSYSARTGGTAPTNGDSTLSQTFTAPTGNSRIALYTKIVCPDTLTYDWVTVTLKDNTSGTTATLLAKTCSNTGAWTSVGGAVTAGHSYTLKLLSHDDNYTGDSTYAVWDDVALK